MSQAETTVPEELLKVLVCPADHGELTVEAEGAKLRCRTCGRAYPVREGIPVMLLEEAEMPETKGDNHG
jgi:uncharacterized protein